jgi:hypothetical protein
MEGHSRSEMMAEIAADMVGDIAIVTVVAVEVAPLRGYADRTRMAFPDCCNSFFKQI